MGEEKTDKSFIDIIKMLDAFENRDNYTRLQLVLYERDEIWLL